MRRMKMVCSLVSGNLASFLTGSPFEGRNKNEKSVLKRLKKNFLNIFGKDNTSNFIILNLTV